MEKKIRFGVCEWALPWSGTQNCKIMSDIGIEGVVLELGSYEHGWPLSNPRIQKEYVQAGKDWGIEFPTLAVNEFCVYSMTSLEGSDTRRIVKEGIIKAIDAAANMGIPKVYYPSFIASTINTEKDFEMTADCFRMACDHAEKSGIEILSENGLNVEESLKLKDLVGRKNYKIYFDTQNPYLLRGLYAPDMIRKLGSEIAEVHVKDGVGRILSGAMLGKGDAAFLESAEALKEIEFSGWIVSENYYDRLPLRLENPDPFAMLKQDLELLKSLF